MASNLFAAGNERIEWDAKSGGLPSELRRVQIAAVVSAEPYLAADSSAHYVAWRVRCGLANAVYSSRPRKFQKSEQAYCFPRRACDTAKDGRLGLDSVTTTPMRIPTVYQQDGLPLAAPSILAKVN